MEIENYIIIECEKEYEYPNHQKRNADTVSGIEYAKFLRRSKKEKRPILFVSTSPVLSLLKKKDTGIITSIGHTYLKKGYSSEQFNDALLTINPLNEIQLKDIIHNFCQPRSSVREGFHAFKGRINSIKGKSITGEKKDSLFKAEFASYEIELKKEAGEYPAILKEYKRIIAQYNSEEPNSIEYITGVQEESFVYFLPTDDESNEQITVEQKPWKVLLLDDEPEGLQPVIEMLKTKKIQYVIAASSKEAKTIIQQDEKNDITVVICDYRLCEPPNEQWIKPKMQAEQGYDFLIWLATQNRYNAMVALSGLSKWFLMDSFRKYQINVKVYSKTGLNTGGARLIVDDIEYLGDRMYETILSLPTAVEWKKQLLPYYKWYKLECTEADSFETTIAAKSEEIIQQLDKQLELRSRITDEKERNKYLRLQDSVGRATEIFEEAFDENKIDAFKLKLVYRRVLIYYLIKGTIPIHTVAKVLNLGSADSQVRDNKNALSDDQDYKGMKKQVLSCQGVKESDIPFNILIEEKLWLKHKMGVEIVNAQFAVNQFFELLEFTYSVLKQQFPKMSALAPFEQIFTSGKSTSTINKDLQILLKTLKATDEKLFKDFLHKIESVISEIRGYIYPLDSYENIEQTLNSYKR